MKKFVLFLSVFFIYNLNLQSQFGLRFGLNSSSIKFKTLGLNVETDSRLGFHLGVVQDFQIEEKLFLRSGLLFSVKGGKATDSSTDASNKVTINYIEVPISAIYYFMEEGRGFFGELGPYIGGLISASTNGESIKDEFRTIDIGVNIGAGYDFNNFIIGANYSVGLSNIAKANDDDFDVTAKNVNLNFFGIYQF